MSDLRTRIAAVVDEHPLSWDNGEGDWRCFCHADTVPGGWAIHVADAVIRELGLPPTWGTPSFDNGETATRTRSAEKLGLTGGGE